jgi:DNA anti-recombination protein RmuC
MNEIHHIHKKQTFFGQDCLTEKLQQSGIEQNRLVEENENLRKLNNGLAIALNEAREQIASMGLTLDHFRLRSEKGPK